MRKKFLKAMKLFLPDNPLGAEIGVLNGDFSEMILEVIQPKKLILIDPFNICVDTYGEEMNYLPTAYSTPNDFLGLINRFETGIRSKKIVVDIGFSYDTVSNYEDKSLDFIYIDGSHKYLDVKRDLNDWLPKIKEGGLIAGHDYIKIEGFGVIQAVDEFCKEQGFEMIIFNETGGDYALKKI